jgi:hypothetical protein
MEASIRAEKQFASASVSRAIEKLACDIGYEQVLAFHIGTHPYLKLWHDGLDRIFDFKSGWEKRRQEEAAKIERARQREVEAAEREAKLLARRQDLMNLVSGSDTHDEEAKEVDGEREEHGAQRDGNQGDLKTGESDAAEFWRRAIRPAHKSWQVLVRRFSNSADRNQALCDGSIKPRRAHCRPPLPDWAFASSEKVSSPRKRKVPEKEVVRAYNKVFEFVKQGRDCQSPKSFGHGMNLSQNSSAFSGNKTDWSSTTLSDALDFLRCAELVIENTISDHVLVRLSGNEVRPLHRQLEMPDPSNAAESKSETFLLEFDYIDEIEERELVVKTAIEVIITLNQHLLWRLPPLTTGTSIFLADIQKQKQKRKVAQNSTPTDPTPLASDITAELSLRRKQWISRRQRFATGNAAGIARSFSTPETQSVAEPKSPPIIEGACENGSTRILVEESDLTEDCIKRLVHAAESCTTKEEAYLISNTIDKLLNDHALLVLPLENDFPSNRPLGSEVPSAQKVHVADTSHAGRCSPADQRRVRAEVPEVAQLREARITLRLRFVDMAKNHLHLINDAVRINGSTQLAALLTYSDVLQARALSLLRRLVALRTRMKLQSIIYDTIHAKKKKNASIMISRESSGGTTQIEGLGEREETERSVELLNLRTVKTFAELHAAELDQFRRQPVDLQIHTIDHQISLKNATGSSEIVNMNAKRRADMTADTSQSKETDIDRYLEVFVMNAWDKIDSMPSQNLLVRGTTLKYILSMLPQDISSFLGCQSANKALTETAGDEHQKHDDKVDYIGAILSKRTLCSLG